MSVTDTYCHAAPTMDNPNAVSVRRIYNARGEPILEAHLANADASVCSRCGEAIDQGTVYKGSGSGYVMSLARLGTGTATKNMLNVTCEDCAPDYVKRELREGGWRNRFTKQPCGACSRPAVLKRRRGRLHVFCSPRCEWAYYNTRASEAAADRAKSCEVCGESFTATRRDAKTCSSSCKQKAYRLRKKEGAA